VPNAALVSIRAACRNPVIRAKVRLASRASDYKRKAKFHSGVIVRTTNRNVPDSRIDEMKEFDLKLLDRRSYGLSRNYPECPNYTDDFTLAAIKRRLAVLPARLSARRP